MVLPVLNEDERKVIEKLSHRRLFARFPSNVKIDVKYIFDRKDILGASVTKNLISVNVVRS